MQTDVSPPPHEPTHDAYEPCVTKIDHRYHEALPSLYHHLTLIFTSLPLAYDLLVSRPSPSLTYLRSLHLSLSIPYAALHNHNYKPSPNSSIIPRRNQWAELCEALSSLHSSGAVRDLGLRLDLEEDNRFWWEVRETWALSAISADLRQHTRLFLPDLTVVSGRMEPYQYSTSEEQQKGKFPDAHDDPVLTYPFPGYTTSPARQAEKNRQESDFGKLVRYSRRRWMRENEGDGLQVRLEFFNPHDHAETSGDKLIGMFRGMLMW